jgi:hypothetical protein
MLNVCQLMIALLLDWLTVTFPVPVPETVAAPPTTEGDLGSAAPGIAPSVSSAVAVSNTLERRGRISQTLG